MACTCIAEMNEKLAGRNSRLVATMCWTRDRQTGEMGQPYDTITISTEKVETRKRDSATALATFCPFCGVRYVLLPEAASTAPDAS